MTSSSPLKEKTAKTIMAGKTKTTVKTKMVPKTRATKTKTTRKSAALPMLSPWVRPLVWSSHATRVWLRETRRRLRLSRWQPWLWTMSQPPPLRSTPPKRSRRRLLLRIRPRMTWVGQPRTRRRTRQQKTLNKNKLNKIIKLRIEFKFEKVLTAEMAKEFAENRSVGTERDRVAVRSYLFVR